MMAISKKPLGMTGLKHEKWLIYGRLIVLNE
jgi:hypothetical protein